MNLYKFLTRTIPSFIQTLYQNYFAPNHKMMNGYAWLKANYVFLVDSYVETNQGIKVNLSVIGTRNTHHASIASIINDTYLLQTIDPRHLAKIGYHAYSSTFLKKKQIADFIYIPNILRALINNFNFLKSDKLKNSRYAYYLDSFNNQDDKVKLKVGITQTKKYFEIYLDELIQDIFMASQFNPRQLVKLGYELAEQKINLFT